MNWFVAGLQFFAAIVNGAYAVYQLGKGGNGEGWGHAIAAIAFLEAAALWVAIAAARG